MKKFYTLFPILAFILLLFNSCDNRSNGKEEERPDRTVFVYMAMDNSLSYYGLVNINDMVANATKANMGNGNIVVFYDGQGTAPQLIKISPGENGMGQREIIKEYNELDSADPEVFRSVLNDVLTLSKAESYGLIVGTHGSGWLPRSFSSRKIFSSAASYSGGGVSDPIQTRAILEDEGGGYKSIAEMEDFAAAVPDGLFDFIIFDVCMMGNLETAYAFRKKADYIVASPAEVVIDGMRYTTMVPYLFKADVSVGMRGVAEDFYNLYSSQNGWRQTALIGVYNCAYMDELAASLKELTDEYYTAAWASTDAAFANIQAYDLYSRQTMYEITDFVNEICPAAFGDRRRDVFFNALDKVVEYQKATSGILGSATIDPSRHSGMAVYPVKKDYSDLNSFYMNLQLGKFLYPDGLQ